MAILMRKYGQEVIKATAGKKVHGTGAIPGGINKNLSIQERDELQKDIDQMLEWSVAGLNLLKKFYRDDIKRMSSFAAFDSNHLSIVAPDGRFDLYDGNLRAKDAAGKIIFDQVKPADYFKVIAGGGPLLELHEVPLHQEPGPGEGLVPGGAAGPGEQLRLHGHPAGREGAPGVHEAGRRAAW